MTSPLAGILIVTRHGDRQGFYQSPQTYSASSTNLTVLGFAQEYSNGQYLRDTYLTSSTGIQGIDPNVAESTQILAQADAGGEGGVIVDSAAALLQGLYPPYHQSILLANQTTISWERAQLIPITTIEPEQDVSFEGYSECEAFQDRLNAWYLSDDFVAKSQEAKPFYDSIAPIVGARSHTLVDAWNIFDYLNVEFIHNSTLSPVIGENNREQARYWANYHEAGAFSDPDPRNVGNVAGQAFLPPLLANLNSLANASNPLKVSYMAASYKPFLSLFSMMNVSIDNNVVDYASAAIFEVREDQTIRFSFRNGSEGAFTTYALLDSPSPSMALSDFHSAMAPYSLDTLAKWCDLCRTADARGCGVLASLNGTGGGEVEYASITSTTGRHRVSPVVAGLIGAFVALAVTMAFLATWLSFGGLVKKQRKARSGGAAQERALASLAAANETPGHSGFELPPRAPQASDVTARADDDSDDEDLKKPKTST